MFGRDRLALVGVDVVDSINFGEVIFSVFVRISQPKASFRSHHQFGVRESAPKSVLERRFVFHFGFVYAQLFSNNFLTCCSMFDMSVVPFALRQVV